MAVKNYFGIRIQIKGFEWVKLLFFQTNKIKIIEFSIIKGGEKIELLMIVMLIFESKLPSGGL